jgi:hypothetical protein
MDLLSYIIVPIATNRQMNGLGHMIPTGGTLRTIIQDAIHVTKDMMSNHEHARKAVHANDTTTTHGKRG